jgi:transposase
MRIVGALDVHRQQITYKTVDLDSGEVCRGRIEPATRASVREWLAVFEAVEGVVALEGTTGWRFVVEELEQAGLVAHLADPAETAARRGRKRRAKTDHADCDLQLRLLLAGELPESWIPPLHLLELRTRVRTRKALLDQRTEWQQRLKAQFFHQGLPAAIRLRSRSGRAALAGYELSRAGREQVEIGLRMLDHLDGELAPLDAALAAYARRQPGCRALMRALYGVGPLTSTTTLAELGDCRRFSSSDDAVRHSGLDVTVYQSDRRRAPGRIAREGPPLLRWALFEAAQSAARAGSPDHAYYLQVKTRIDHNRACLAVARKLCRRAYHLLRELGDDALAPPDHDPATAASLPEAA